MSERSSVQPRRWDYLNLLKFLACILITNSHCREIYPWYFLAVGGGHGNGLFFIVSGFLLANIRLPFGEWIAKRTKRLLPVTGLFVLISILLTEGIGYLAGVGAVQACLLLINKYWFVAAILLYYPLYYLIFSSKNRRIPAAALIAWAIGYALIYVFLVDKTGFTIELEGFYPFKVLFYFGIFLMGGLLRRSLDQAKGFFEKSGRWSWLAGAAAASVLWAAVYAAVMVLGRGFEVQFLIHAGVFCFSVSLFMFAYKFRTVQLPDAWWAKAVKAAAESTLEIYLLQVTIQKYVVHWPFPVNWIVFWGCAFGGGILIHQVFGWLEDRLSRKPAKSR